MLVGSLVFALSEPHLCCSSSGEFGPVTKKCKMQWYHFNYISARTQRMRHFLALFCVPDGTSKERVKCVQPVMHLFVIASLQKYPTMLCAHSKCVGSLQKDKETCDSHFVHCHKVCVKDCNILLTADCLKLHEDKWFTVENQLYFI